MSSNECAGLQTQYDVFSLDKAETLALLHGCGFSYEELKKPRVAVFNTLNPMNPGHIHQGAIAKAVAEGVREAGGTQAILHELRKHLDTNCMSVNEKTIGENISGHEILAPSIIHPLSNPLDNQGGLALMRGNLVPDGTYIKQSAVPECLMKLRGPAHVFNNMDDANNAHLNHEIKAGEIVIIRYLGPKASYDSAYWFTSQLKGSDLYTKVAVITDGCLSGAASGASFQFAAPEAALNSPLAAVRNGDIIEYDIHARTMNVELTDEEIQQRISELTGEEYPHFTGYLGIYQKGCISISKGAVLR